MPTEDLHLDSLAQLSRRLRDGATTPIEITRHFLDRIARFDPRLHAFVEVRAEQALEEAAAATRKLEADSDRGPLFGLPFAAKDLFDVAGMATGAGTRLLRDNVAAHDAAAVRRLRQAGMILLGKTHTVQLAYGGAGVNHDTGTPHNPWLSEHHLPGGSSSGSAVAVAAGLAPLALGTDTGGSVRVPASLCGITGLKTTVGRVSRDGVYPLSWSLDSVGPLARTAADAATALRALSGADDGDPTTWGRPASTTVPAEPGKIAGLRLAFAETAFWEGADPEVAQGVRNVAEVFRDLGADVTSIPFEEAGRALELNPRGLVIAAEAYTLNRRLLEDHFDELDPVVASRMIHGREVTGEEYFEKLLAWQALRVEARRTFTELDVLLCPTTPIAALPLAEADADLETYLDVNFRYLRNTSIGNILDLCGVSVPCGRTARGLPIGLTLYGRPFDESTVLRVAMAFQSVTDHHRQTPDLAWAAS